MNYMKPVPGQVRYARELNELYNRHKELVPTEYIYMSHADGKVGHVLDLIWHYPEIADKLDLPPTPESHKRVVDNALRYIYSLAGEEFKPPHDVEFSNGDSLDPKEYVKAAYDINKEAAARVLESFNERSAEAVALLNASGHALNTAKFSCNSTGNTTLDGGISDLGTLKPGSSMEEQLMDPLMSCLTSYLFASKILGIPDDVYMSGLDGFKEIYSRVFNRTVKALEGMGASAVQGGPEERLARVDDSRFHEMLELMKKVVPDKSVILKKRL